MIGGILLLVLPVVYAVVMVWLRGGWMKNEELANDNSLFLIPH